MLANKITSLQHPIVKELVSLRQNKEDRQNTNTVLVMGKKMILDLAPRFPIKMLFLLEGTSLLVKAEKTFSITEPILKKITGLENPDGYAAVFPLPQEQDLSEKKTLIVLNNLSDPGNLGTLFRSALGLGWEGIFLTPGTVDPCNDKALRAAKGATFHMPYSFASEEEILQIAANKNMTIYVAALKGQNVKNISFKAPFLLVLGNEGAGPAASFLKRGTQVSIPMSSDIESYNVATAGSILMYAMRGK